MGGSFSGGTNISSIAASIKAPASRADAFTGISHRKAPTAEKGIGPAAGMNDAPTPPRRSALAIGLIAVNGTTGCREGSFGIAMGVFVRADCSTTV